MHNPPHSHSAHTHRTASSLVLIGGGGHAVVVAEAATLVGVKIAGFLDDNPSAALATLPFRLPSPPPPFPNPAYLGMLDDLDQLAGHEWIIALGDLAHRRRVLNELRSRGHLPKPPPPPPPPPRPRARASAPAASCTRRPSFHPARASPMESSWVRCRSCMRGRGWARTRL